MLLKKRNGIFLLFSVRIFGQQGENEKYKNINILIELNTYIKKSFPVLIFSPVIIGCYRKLLTHILIITMFHYVYNILSYYVSMLPYLFYFSVHISQEQDVPERLFFFINCSFFYSSSISRLTTYHLMTLKRHRLGIAKIQGFGSGLMLTTGSRSKILSFRNTLFIIC